jgi:hypothetical protein
VSSAYPVNHLISCCFHLHRQSGADAQVCLSAGAAVYYSAKISMRTHPGSHDWQFIVIIDPVRWYEIESSASDKAPIQYKNTINILCISGNQ